MAASSSSFSTHAHKSAAALITPLLQNCTLDRTVPSVRRPCPSAVQHSAWVRQQASARTFQPMETCSKLEPMPVSPRAHFHNWPHSCSGLLNEGYMNGCSPPAVSVWGIWNLLNAYVGGCYLVCGSARGGLVAEEGHLLGFWKCGASTAGNQAFGGSIVTARRHS